MNKIHFYDNRLFLAAAAGALTILLGGCAGSEGQRLMREGASPAYAQGFDDGCSSGKRAGGDMFAQFHKNVRAFQMDPDYRQGWNDGNAECRSEEISNLRQQEMGIEQERAMEEYRRNERLEERDMVRDAMPELTPQQIHDLRNLGR